MISADRKPFPVHRSSFLHHNVDMHTADVFRTQICLAARFSQAWCGWYVQAQAVMVDPVLAACCGASFERAPAEAHAARCGTCDACGAPLVAEALVPNRSLRTILANMRAGP